MSLPPFHLAFPVDDLAAARRFYGGLLGCREGRSAAEWVDFDLYGMLANFLYSGHYKLPAAHTRLKEWHARMTTLKSARLQ